jgi:hypothetical protein
VIADRFTAACYAGRGIQLEYDRASDTYRLGPDAIAEVERTTCDGSLLSLVEAAEYHRKGETDKAHRLQLLVHLRGLELGSEAMKVAALNICREAHGCAPARSSRPAS